MHFSPHPCLTPSFKVLIILVSFLGRQIPSSEAAWAQMRYRDTLPVRPANMQMQRRKMRPRGEAHNGGWRFKTRPETFTWLVTLVPHNDGSMHRASKSSLVMFKSERSAANLFLASTSSSSISFCRLPTQFQRLQNLKVLPLQGYSP